MPEQDQGQAQAQAATAKQQAQGPVLRIRDHDTKTAYANVCLLANTREEMILSFGMTLPVGGQDKPQAEMLVSDRVVMSLPAAKRLAIALSQSVQQFENSFGVIDLEPRPAAGQMRQAPPQRPADK